MSSPQMRLDISAQYGSQPLDGASPLDRASGLRVDLQGVSLNDYEVSELGKKIRSVIKDWLAERNQELQFQRKEGELVPLRRSQSTNGREQRRNTPIHLSSPGTSTPPSPPFPPLSCPSPFNLTVASPNSPPLRSLSHKEFDSSRLERAEGVPEDYELRTKRRSSADSSKAGSIILSISRTMDQIERTPDQKEESRYYAELRLQLFNLTKIEDITRESREPNNNSVIIKALKCFVDLNSPHKRRLYYLIESTFKRGSVMGTDIQAILGSIDAETNNRRKIS